MHFQCYVTLSCHVFASIVVDEVVQKGHVWL